MSKYLGMTDDEILALKGADLKTAAAELDILGRSKMKADELRVAVHVTIIEMRKVASALTWTSNEDAVSYSETVPVHGSRQDEAEASMDAFDRVHGTDETSPLPDNYVPRLSMPDECFEDETNDILADQETMNAIAVGEEEAEKFELVPNRKARRDAARKQRKAAGRIAQKHNRNN